MHLSSGHIHPGRVLAVADSKQGTIKATVCGLFSDADSPDKLPPIYPWQPACANSFSSVRPGDDIWVIFFSDNPMELFWLRNDNIPESLSSVLSEEYKHCDVLMSRDLPGGLVQLYFTDGTGWVLRNGTSAIMLKPDGSVLIDGGMANRKIELNQRNISIGSEGRSAHPVAYGDKTEEALNAVVRVLKACAEAGKSNPYTIVIAQAIESVLPALENAIPEVSSLDVTVD